VAASLKSPECILSRSSGFAIAKAQRLKPALRSRRRHHESKRDGMSQPRSGEPRRFAESYKYWEGVFFESMKKYGAKRRI
jgi:hypothetical protein